MHGHVLRSEEQHFSRFLPNTLEIRAVRLLLNAHCELRIFWEFPERPCNMCSPGCPESYLWIKSSHQRSLIVCQTVLFWPFLSILLLNYALVPGHWPTLKEFIWNSSVKCIIIGSLRKHRKHRALYHTESSLWENKEEISLRFTNQE